MRCPGDCDPARYAQYATIALLAVFAVLLIAGVVTR